MLLLLLFFNCIIFLQDLEKLDERQRRSTLMHGEYVDSLTEVVHNKLDLVTTTMKSYEQDGLWTNSSDEFRLDETGRPVVELERAVEADDVLPPIGTGVYSSHYARNRYFLFSPKKVTVKDTNNNYY